MSKITIEIKNEELFDLLKLRKERLETWKNYLLLCIIRDEEHRLNLYGGGMRKGQRERIITLLRLEGGERIK